jgi:hypothetical protein
MADWRQIQARIRKAKNSTDAPAKLSELYQRTRDAMVAWELGAVEEKAQRNDEAGRWYTIAAQRFRRAEWKKKAEEALTRLGIALPVAGSAPVSDEVSPSFSEAHAKTQPLAHGEIPPEAPQDAEEDAPEHTHDDAEVSDHDGNSSPETAVAAGAASDPSDPLKKKRRRGRRGGRGRRRKPGAAAPGLPSQSFAEAPKAPPTPHVQQHVQQRHPAPPRSEHFEPPVVSRPEPPRASHIEHPEPQLPSERTAHGRAGDPALASRMAHLESMLRRLVASPLHRLEEADEAPAGPGVFLLSDSDQITSYYIEACQTLRVGLGNLVRGGRGGKTTRGGRGFSDSALKAKLAEHLEISEAKVSQYLKDHCVVRWIQLDDGAQHLAHFAIGVLRTPLNAD